MIYRDQLDGGDEHHYMTNSNDELDSLREQLARVTEERDAARSAHAVAECAFSDAADQRDELRAKLNSQAVVLAESHRLRGQLQRECDELRELARRAVVYAREDRMMTPGVTRLQRVLDAFESALNSKAGV